MSVEPCYRSAPPPPLSASLRLPTSTSTSARRYTEIESSNQRLLEALVLISYLLDGTARPFELYVYTVYSYTYISKHSYPLAQPQTITHYLRMDKFRAPR